MISTGHVPGVKYRGRIGPAKENLICNQSNHLINQSVRHSVSQLLFYRPSKKLTNELANLDCRK